MKLSGSILYLTEADCGKLAHQTGTSLGLVEVGIRVNGSATDDVAAAASIFNKNGGTDLKGAIQSLGEKKAKLQKEGVAEEYDFATEKTIAGESKAISYVNSKVDNAGTLSFAIRADKRTGVQGWQMLDQMFAFHGASIQRVEGNWFYETNIDMFKQNLANSLAKMAKTVDELSKSDLDVLYQQAAKSTWTGQQLAKKGFSEVQDVEVLTDPSNGEIFEVPATFTRPN